MKKLSRRLRAVVGEEGRLAHSSSNTKLYAEDYEEVQRRCVGGRTESFELRELVHSGLQREHYRKAASDPAIRELLRTFQEMLDHSLADVERRLREQIQIESCLAANYLLEIYPLARFAAEVLGQLPADLAPAEQRQQAWDNYGALYEQMQREGQEFTDDLIRKRDEAARKLRQERAENSLPAAPGAAPQSQTEG
jgi:hypothetical protein